jgi:hypothetical protein
MGSGPNGEHTAEDVATERAMTASSTIDSAMRLSHDDPALPVMLAAAQVEATLSLAAEVRALRDEIATKGPR